MHLTISRSNSFGMNTYKCLKFKVLPGECDLSYFLFIAKGVTKACELVQRDSYSEVSRTIVDMENWVCI